MIRLIWTCFCSTALSVDLNVVIPVESAIPTCYGRSLEVCGPLVGIECKMDSSRHDVRTVARAQTLAHIHVG